MTIKSKHQAQYSLCLMMFLQYLLVAVWWVPFPTYLTNIGIEGNFKSLILSSMAFGFIFSPMIGVIADRYLAAQKLLSLLNALVAVLLLLAWLIGSNTATNVIIFTAMLFYMPTWSLTGTIVLKNLKSENFPRVRLFGTLGWVASGLFSIVAIKILNIPKFDGTSLPFLCGSAVAAIAAISNLYLPNIPPDKTGGKISISELLGLRAFSLFKDRNFTLFFACSLAAVLSFTLYYTYGADFLHDRKFEYITLTLNWGQVGELLFLFITPLIIKRFGIRRAMIFGLLALLLRYVAFWLGVNFDQNGFYITGILFHGLIFGLFFVTGQIYTDNVSPANLRSQAQGLLALLLWGAGLLAGNFICGQLINSNQIIDIDGNITYNWKLIFGITSVFTAALLVVFCVCKPKQRDN
ncbi:MAG: MFS transporter [Paludibacter sp.]|jgi:nucleoside transporter|nr:MFS transporter [Paludibacter sp.]